MKNTEPKDIYQIITNKIIDKIENGTIPWKKPWGKEHGEACNYITRKPYSGINCLLLFGDFQYPYFLTFKQCNSLGGRIKKGAKAEIITYWNWLYFDKETGEKLSNEQAKLLPIERIKKSGFLKYYNVFNVSDVEGIDLDLPKTITKSDDERFEECERILDQYPNKPKYAFGGDEAYYSHLTDYIQMPHFTDFIGLENYYSTFFHELIHSTGHSKRLNRSELTTIEPFGSENYSKEELTAEIGASFLCGKTNILPTTLNLSASYIEGWLKVLKEDKKFILEAATKAQQAVDFILGNKDVEEREE